MERSHLYILTANSGATEEWYRLVRETELQTIKSYRKQEEGTVYRKAYNVE